MKFRIKTISLTLVVPLLIGLSLVSCNTSKTLRGGAIGAGAGGAIGGIIGSQSGNTATGAILGAAIGGTAGAAIGNYMDKQAEELQQDIEGAEIERVGEGIKITFDSGILFGFDSSDLSSKAEVNVSEMAKILKKYEDTEIIIEGHTDNKGSDRYNLKLSEDRAHAVARLLTILGVNEKRISEVGYGEEMPVAENDTELGRMKNRRVEVAIYASEELKKAAQKGNLSSD